MAGEQEPILGFKELRGVRYTENNAAALLEKHLGIIIPEHPKTVVLTPRNRLALYRDTDFKRQKRFSLLNVIYNDSVRFLGYYENKSNTCILKRKAQEETDETPLHEAMHAFIDQANPEIPQLINRFFQKNNPLDLDYRTAEAYLTFLEGIATWGSLETIALIQGKTNKEARENIHKEVMKKRLGINDKNLTDKDITQQFALMEERRNLWETLKDNPKDGKQAKKYDKSAKKISIQITACGHYFVDRAMSELTNQSISVGDALRILVLNPPQPPRALDQLQDPVAYADELIVYYIHERRRIPEKN